MTAFLLNFHGWFFLSAAVVLAPPLLGAAAPYSMGTALCAIVAGWHIAFACLTHATRLELYRMWRFGAVLSVFQIVPDWFLDRGLGTLHFPADGAYRVGGSVSVYMAGMWTIPVVWVLAACHSSDVRAAAAADGADGGVGGGRRKPSSVGTGWQQQHEPAAAELVRAAVAALLIFGAAEEFTLPLQLWHPTRKVERWIGHVALYVLPAEMLLGAAALWAFRVAGGAGSSALRRTIAAAAVSIFYTGALSVSYLFVEAQ